MLRNLILHSRAQCFTFTENFIFFKLYYSQEIIWICLLIEKPQLIYNSWVTTNTVLQCFYYFLYPSMKAIWQHLGFFFPHHCTLTRWFSLYCPQIHPHIFFPFMLPVNLEITSNYEELKLFFPISFNFSLSTLNFFSRHAAQLISFGWSLWSSSLIFIFY